MPMLRKRFIRAVAGGTGALAVSLVMVGTPSAAAATPITVTFVYTGSAQYWTVPSNVLTAKVNVYGAQGGSSGGKGGEATDTLSVYPGEDLQMNVGGDHGYNGGGSGSEGAGAGGGASDIRTPDPDLHGQYLLNDRIIIGGGGGGASADGAGGSGGGTSGTSGAAVIAQDGFLYVTGGGGGTPSAGGAGGNETITDSNTDMTMNVAGTGRAGTGGNGADGGAGGGGGLYGGGGGSGVAADVGAGGGGGSGSGPAGTVFTSGVQTGNGMIVLTYTPVAPTSGSLSITPNNGSGITVINVASVTHCPTSFAGTTVVLMSLVNSTTGSTVTTNNPANMDAAGDWNGVLTVPGGTPAGAYAVTATCSISGVATMDYAYQQFTVASAA